jgi:hypothetical protein
MNPGDFPVQVVLNGVTSVLTARPKTFSTGSKGAMLFGRVTDVDGVQHQMTGNLVIIGSNPNKVATVKGKKPSTARASV